MNTLAPHCPPLTLAIPDPRPERPAATPVAVRAHDPGARARHTLRGCPARGIAGGRIGSPCVCTAGAR